MANRSSNPVFVVGCERSGTTLLYHTLLSAGGFADFRAETHVFSHFEPHFGRLRTAGARRKLAEAWEGSRLSSLSGLDEPGLRETILHRCRNGGDFIGAVLGGVAAKQGVERWADCTPAHLLYMRRIKQVLPTAQFLHIIRDGRDVALSLAKLNWVDSLPLDRTEPVVIAGLYWDWVVSTGRHLGRSVGDDYFELRFEDLVQRPRDTLEKIGEFIGHELDRDRIQRVAIGSVGRPNTSFVGESGSNGFNPVARWRNRLDGHALAELEGLIGQRLRELGYETSGAVLPVSPLYRGRRRLYHLYYSLKLHLKNAPLLGRFVALDFL